MQIEKAQRLTLSLVQFHGHTDWTIKFNQQKTTFGWTKYQSKTLEFSVPLILANDEHELIDTVLHEIAHIRAGAAADHGPVWARKAVELGADPNWKERKSNPAEGRYTGICSCGKLYTRYRRPGRGYVCRLCSGIIYWVDKTTNEEVV